MVLVTVLMGMACASAQTPAPDVKVSVLSDHAEVASGESFVIGVLLELPDGWHVYWKNPGDAGLATSVAWRLPDGFTVSDLMWPVPRRFVQAGDIEGFGYEGQVMLMARVKPLAGFRGAARIEADVRWLACKDVCVPGKAHGLADVQVGPSSRPTNEQVFAQWLRKVPADVGSGAVSAAVHREGLRFGVAFTGLPAGGEIAAFPAPPEGVTVRSLKHSADTVSIEFARLPAASAGGAAELVVAKEDKAIRILLPLQ